MRTLKKTLALVLVLAMMFSLCITASADFTDADEITYVEAADVLAAIGVIEGMPDGSFDAKGTLTRAQAAVMITRLLGAEDYAIATAGEFTDVAEGHWAAGAISFCVDAGIVAGYGDGKFGPSDTLTGYQWAKMLLCALGYSAETEGMTGAAWQIAVAKLANNQGIFVGNEKADKTAAATREEAALYAFNALTVGMVKYENGLSITIGDLTFTSGGNLVGAGTTLAGMNKLAKVSEDVATDDGLNAHYWTINGKEATGLYVDDVLVASYVAGDAYKDIAAKMGATKTKDVAFDYYANGKVKAEDQSAQSYLTSKDKVPAGISADLYKTAAGEYKLMATVTYVVEASEGKKVTDKTDDNYGKYEFTMGSYAAAKLYGDAKDSYKGYYAVVPQYDNTDAEKFLAIEAVAPIAAKATKYSTTAGTVTVDGTAYPVAEVAGDIYRAVSFTTAKNYYVYDGALYVIDTIPNVEEAVSLDGYVYVVKTQVAYESVAGDLFDTAATSAAAKAQVVFTDATAASVIDLKVVEGTGEKEGKYYLYSTDGTEITAADKEAVPVGEWMGYTVEDGEYVLYDLTDFSDYAGVVISDGWDKKEANAVNGRHTNSATAYTYINVKDGTTATVTGIANIEIAKDTVVLATYAGEKSTVVSNLYVVDFTTAVVDSTASYAYVAKAGATVAAGTEYEIYVDGAVVTYTLKEGTLDAGYVYKDMTVNEKNEITNVGTKLDTKVETASASKVAVVDETFYKLDGAADVTYYVKDVVIYDVTEGVAGTATTIEAGDYIVSLDGGAVIYIVDAPEAE